MKLVKHQDIIQLEDDTNFLPIIKNHPLYISSLQNNLFYHKKLLMNGQCNGVWDNSTNSIYCNLYNEDKLTSKDCDELFYLPYRKDDNIISNKYDIFDWYDKIETSPLFIIHIDTNVNKIRNERNPNNLYKLLLQTSSILSIQLKKKKISHVVLNDMNLDSIDSEHSLTDRLTNLSIRVNKKDKFKKCILLSITYKPNVNAQWIPYNSLELNYSGNNTSFRHSLPIITKLEKELKTDLKKQINKFTNTSILKFGCRDLPFHKTSKYPSITIDLGCPNNIDYCKMIYDNIDVLPQKYTIYLVKIIEHLINQLNTD